MNLTQKIAKLEEMQRAERRAYREQQNAPPSSERPLPLSAGVSSAERGRGRLYQADVRSAGSKEPTGPEGRRMNSMSMIDHDEAINEVTELYKETSQTLVNKGIYVNSETVARLVYTAVLVQIRAELEELGRDVYDTARALRQ